MNVTLKRWLTIIVYGSLFAFLIKAFIQVDWVQKVVNWWGNAFDLFGVYPQKGFLFILGFLLYQFLLKMNIYSKNSSLRTWIVYPPITFILLPFTAVTLTLFFDEFQFNNISWNHGFNLISLVAFITGKSICDFCSCYQKKNLKESENEGNKQESKFSITPNSTYDDYQKWLEVDAPITVKEQLSEELQPYVIRIRDRINKVNLIEKKNVHISLIGNFGSGKSSIIKCVEKELKADFIFCNIDTWVAMPQSINAFVLSKVIESVSQYADMSSFKSLPSEYIEALKLGNNTTKLLAIFSGVTTDPLQGLTKLNSVLSVINKKLLITIQDVDRSSEPKKTINELASLLDKLKEKSNISFIVALGYENEITETIRKVCDYREDIIKPDNHLILLNFIKQLNQKAADKNFAISNGELDRNGDVTASIREIKIKLRAQIENYPNPYDIISSQRSFKHICRRINSIWQKNKLMGEIDLESLSLLVILREELPLIFASVIKNNTTLYKEIRKLKNNETSNQMKQKLGNPTSDQVETKTIILNECAQYYPSIMNFEATKGFLDYLFKCNNDLGQGVLYKYKSMKYSNYLKRVTSEFVPKGELKDQDVIRLFKNVDKVDSVETLINNFQHIEEGSNWIEAYFRFSRHYFRPADKSVYEVIYIAMVNFYYKELIKHNRATNSLINQVDIQKFLITLLEKCLTTKNVKHLFELTLNIPTILMANTVTVETSSCLRLFLNKEQNRELYKIFINKLSVDNEMSKQLYIIDSTNKSLDWVVRQFVPQNPNAFKLFKEIILSLLEKNDKENKFYKFDLWFACYLLDYLRSINEGNSLEKLNLTPPEVELLKSSLNQLNIDDVGEYYQCLSEPKEKYQRVISALDNYA